MSLFIDLTGHKFGKLLVLYRAKNDARGGALWNCLCDCGKNRLVATARLKDGKIWNCGCENKTPMPLIDLTGHRFSKLLVISRVKEQKRKTLYNCVCDCGNKITALSTGLRKGTTRSCHSCWQSSKLIDITGQKFGKLTVLHRYFPQRSSNPLWECLCTCGNKKIVQKDQLNKDSSCGCSRKKSFNTNANFSDLTGQRFGKITVISRTNNGARWNCLCDCGKNIEYYHSHLVDDKFTSCGCAFIKAYNDRTLSSQHALYKNYYNNSKTRGFIFDLSFDQFIEFTKKCCFYCGEIPSQQFKASGAFKCYVYNGLDRLDNSMGYDLDNVVSCCKICNRAKWTLNKDSFIALIKRSYEYSKMTLKHSLKIFEYDSEKKSDIRNLYKIYERTCAKKRNYSFLLSFEEFSNLIQQNCYYCGISPQNPLKIPHKLGVFKYSGLDRVNNALGYETSNVVPCCKFCNIAKSTKTSEEYFNWLKKCYEYLAQKGLIIGQQINS